MTEATLDKMSTNSSSKSYYGIYYDFLFVELADPRTSDWLFMQNVFPIMITILSYLYFSLIWGPKYMKNREPYQFKNVLIIYNFFQVVISLLIFVEGMESAWLTKYSWQCEPVDFSWSAHAFRVAKGCYIYFLAKVTELLDTIFFVLRKKNKQITFLHMYHHTVMPSISWGVVKYYPGGHSTLIGVINSFVHVIMYFYYMLAAAGPDYRKYLWWKKYITTLQMVQFGIAFIHSSQLLFYDCGYPKFTLAFTLPNAIFFYVLFSDFYKQSYKQNTRQDKKKATIDECQRFADAIRNERVQINEKRQ